MTRSRSRAHWPCRSRLRRLVPVAGVVAALCLSGVVARGEIGRDQVDPVLRLDLPGHTSEVRALAFLPDGRLVSGGRDKVVMIWSRPAMRQDDAAPGTRGIGRVPTRAGVIRWQVARGTRGVIQALATTGGDRPLVALGGSGAMGSTGEILVVDPGDGALEAVLGGGDRPGHRAAVGSLDFATDGRWLFSADFDGQVLAWDRQAGWRPRELAARDEIRLGADRTARLAAFPAARPLAAVMGGRVALPVIAEEAGARVPAWRIELCDAGRPADRTPLESPAAFQGVVLAMDATPDGRHLAVADMAGRVVVWDLAAEPVRAVSLAVTPAAESLALADDGARLVVGVAARTGGRGRVEVWDVAAGRRVSASESAAAVRAVAAGPAGLFAAAGGWEHEIAIDRLADGAAAGAGDRGAPAERGMRLGGYGRRIGRVAFAARPAAAGAPRRIAFGVAAEGAAAPPLAEAFDLESLALEPVDAMVWAPAAGRAGAWTLVGPARAGAKPGIESWQLVRAGEPSCALDLEIGWQGRLGPAATCACWLTRDGEAEPWAVAVGTDRGIFVHELAAAGAARVVRRYRGHEDGVLSLAVSDDGRWLASGGRDGVVMLWPLSRIDPAEALFDRWGVALEVREGRAVVAEIDEAGPLAGRDVRVGDVIARISGADGAGGRAQAAVDADPAALPPAAWVTDPAEIVRTLTECPWGRQMAIGVEREGRPLDPFNRLPAWENLASLYLGANREWAYWSPRGYYAASANGDGLFGWLVNRGLERLPRFFRASQFRRRLERPDIMARLLAAGSLPAAQRAAGREVPRSSARVLPDLFAITPEVRIVSPRTDATLDGVRARIEATVELPEAARISRLRAFASGVVGRGEPQLVAERPAAVGIAAARTYAWDLDLPDEDEHLIQVFVGTEAGPTDVGEVTVSVPRRPQAARRRPRLFILAAGIDGYASDESSALVHFPDLRFAATDARAVGAALAARSAAGYEIAKTTLLLDAEMTPATWRQALADIAREIGPGIAPDDLVVLFLAGHGLIDEAAGREYRFLCRGARVKPVPGGLAVEGDGGVGWRDFTAIDDLPCRKVVIVDSCHAGGLGPAGRGTTTREFQENRMLVLAAASDAEESNESSAWGHGAFTRCLLDALSGRADVRTGRGIAPGTGPDGIVTLDEVARYVETNVPRLVAEAGGRGQHPHAAPAGLVPYMTLPLARVAEATEPSKPEAPARE